MARELDAPPVEKKRDKKLVAHEIFRNTPTDESPRNKRGSAPQQGIVSFKEYEALLADRPRKFAAEQVAYRKAEEPGVECEHCIHMFEQVAGEQRKVCEILRLDPEESIDPEYVCNFQSRDGEKYPYQKSSEPTLEGEDEEE